jgi:hypothetical protein
MDCVKPDRWKAVVTNVGSSAVTSAAGYLVQAFLVDDTGAARDSTGGWTISDLQPGQSFNASSNYDRVKRQTRMLFQFYQGTAIISEQFVDLPPFQQPFRPENLVWTSGSLEFDVVNVLPGDASFYVSVRTASSEPEDWSHAPAQTYSIPLCAPEGGRAHVKVTRPDGNSLAQIRLQQTKVGCGTPLPYDYYQFEQVYRESVTVSAKPSAP